MQPPVNIHNASMITARLRIFFGETFLSLGTGFFYEDAGNIYLITNWHNVTGRNPIDNSVLSDTGGIPDRLKMSVRTAENRADWAEVEVPLYKEVDGEDVPAWIEHPIHGSAVDAVAILVDIQADHFITTVNSVDTLTNMNLEVSTDVFVLGYPRGVTGAGLFPVWKRATIASEPGFDLDNLPKILIDTATREGMSGAPVLATPRGTYRNNTGGITLGAGNGAVLVGIYSGRNVPRDQFEAQLGIVWKKDSILQIIDNAP